MRRPAAILTSLIIVAVLVTGTYGAAARQTDARSDRDRVRSEQATVAANVNALEASQSELTAALHVLEDNLRIEQGRLDDAQQAVDAAEAEVAAAQRGIELTTARLAGLRKRMTDVAIEAYVRPTSSSMSAVLESQSASDAAERTALEGLRSNRDADLSDEIATAKAELQAQRRAAAAAQERAVRKRAEVTDRVDKVQSAKGQQQQLVSKVKDRIQGQLARAADLRKKDKALSNQIYREQVALAARVAEQKAAAAAQAQAQTKAKAYGSNGSESSGPVGGGGSSPPSGANVPLCNVGGITVNCQISGQLGRMVSAAAGDGLTLSGGGWRDPSAQIALRREHCGSSHYAIWDMSPSACSPPTARPGQSMHEVGLAIDFNSCQSHSTACYQWLSSHAGSYGFINLRSEPWHWSVNGQ